MIVIVVFTDKNVKNSFKQGSEYKTFFSFPTFSGNNRATNGEAGDAPATDPERSVFLPGVVLAYPPYLHSWVPVSEIQFPWWENP